MNKQALVPILLLSLLALVVYILVKGYINYKKVKKLQEKLRDIETRQQQLLQQLNWAVIFLNRRLQVEFMNNSAESLTGLNTQLAKNLPIHRLVELRQLDLPESIDLTTWIPKNRENKRLECNLISRNWRTFHIALSSIAWPHQDNPTGYILIIEDLSEKMLQLQRMHHHEKMETVGRLAGGIAHDFNNLLSVITGYSELLEKSLEKSDKRLRYVEHIINTSSRAEELINQLLAFSRNSPLKMVSVDILSVIDKIRELLKHSIDKKITIYSHSDEQEYRVWGDESQLENLFLNLGINSCDAMEDGGVLTFSSELVQVSGGGDIPFVLKPESGEYICISCRDKGHGMEADVLENLFEPFYTTKSVGKGTGLGLSAVYGTVQAHHGGIALISEVDEGTEFQIYLPIHRE
ncbi:MAG: ATP-binding protein [Spirochaetaceae bacterium]|jgi:signal transduction histidine kinase|nr:ATP-binding protein [Spirochaetaceae bacterium]